MAHERALDILSAESMGILVRLAEYSLSEKASYRLVAVLGSFHRLYFIFIVCIGDTSFPVELSVCYSFPDTLARSCSPLCKLIMRFQLPVQLSRV